MALTTEEASILDRAVDEATSAPPDATLTVPARLILALHQENAVTPNSDADMAAALIYGFTFGTLFGWLTMLAMINR